MSFSDANVTAYVDGSSQRTKEITFKADKLQSITMKLPSGVKLHNVTTGKTSKAGEAVEIIGVLFISTIDTGAGCCRKLVSYDEGKCNQGLFCL